MCKRQEKMQLRLMAREAGPAPASAWEAVTYQETTENLVSRQGLQTFLRKGKGKRPKEGHPKKADMKW